MSNSDSYYLSNLFQFTTNGPSSDILNEAFERYYNIIFPSQPSPEPIPGLTEITSLQVIIQDLDNDFIQFGIDESYHLYINDSISTLTAQNVFGAMHGLETFSQLIRFQRLPEAEIHDYPRFPWRGLLIDCSRHYQTIDTIKRAIRGMSYDKMNVLHWHISDGQSFPFQSQVFPDLTLGAFSPQYIYTRSDVNDIISYANSYGIRVVVEFDMPAHSGPAWGKGYPYLTMNCSILLECHDKLNYYTDPCSDFPFDATNDQVYEFLDQFINEISQVFPDNYLHLGGDEVKTICWAIPRVLQWMEDHNMDNFNELEQYFLTKIQQIAINNNKLIINWEEVFTSNFSLAPGTIIEVWKDSQTLDQVANAGYGALLSYNWYLDHLDSTWEDFYLNEPDSGNLNSTALQNLYGGETCMWAEKVDETNFDPKVWPRNSAAAERLWSSKSIKNISNASLRLAFHRCRLKNRGISASPINAGPPCSLYYL